MKKTMISVLVASCFAAIGTTHASEIVKPISYTSDQTISDNLNVVQVMGEGQGGSVNMVRASGGADNKGATINFTGNSLVVDSTVNRSWNSENTNYTFGGVLAAAYVDKSDNKPRNGAVLNLGGTDTEIIDVKVHVTGTGLDSKGKPDGLGAIGLWAYNQYVATDLQTNEGGQLNAKAKNILINVHSENGSAYGVLAQNSTTKSTATNTATVRLKADKIVINTTAGTEDSACGLVALSQGRIYVDGNLEINAHNAIVARGEALVSINEDGAHYTKLNGNIDFNYDKATSGTKADATVKVNLTGSDSYWVGNATTSYGTGEPPEGYDSVNGLTLNMSNGAQWTPTAVVAEADTTTGLKSVPINNMDLDGGVVNITGSDVDVTVQNLTGTGGTIKLATDLEAEEKTGKFTVGKAAEESKLDVKLMDKDNEKALTSDEINADQAKELLANVTGTEVTTAVEEGMYNSAFSIDAEGTAKTAGPNTVMQSSLEIVSAAPLAINRILMNDVRKRLGDIRSAKGTSGAWARYDGGRLSGSNGLENDFNTIQVGVDTQPSADPVRFGLAFSYTNGDTDYARGSADMDTYSLAGYGGWLGESGQFVDVIARFAQNNTDLTIDGTKTGSLDNKAVSLSGEFGWRFDVTDLFYVEPQVEATYTYVDGDNLNLSDGSSYKYDSMSSLLGRAGVAFGVTCPNNRGNVYARVSAVHEFLGDSTVTGANGAKYEIDGKDTWVEYGVGANFNLTDSTYIWADVERTSGGVLDEDYRATVGVRYSF